MCRRPLRRFDIDSVSVTCGPGRASEERNIRAAGAVGTEVLILGSVVNGDLLPS